MKDQERQQTPDVAGLASALSPALEALLSFNVATVRFATRIDAVKGFGIVRRTGHIVEVLGKNMLGLTSREQLAALDRAEVTYERLA